MERFLPSAVWRTARHSEEEPDTPETADMVDREEGNGVDVVDALVRDAELNELKLQLESMSGLVEQYRREAEEVQIARERLQQQLRRAADVEVREEGAWPSQHRVPRQGPWVLLQFRACLLQQTRGVLKGAVL